MAFLITFSLVTLINVILTTIKSIATIKCGKLVASFANGISQAFYILVVVYTVADFPTWQKMLITFGCYFFGVWFVKYFEEKLAKEKIWLISATFYKDYQEQICKALDKADIEYSYNIYGKHIRYDIYSNTKKDSAIVKSIIEKYKGRYFISTNGGIL